MTIRVEKTDAPALWARMLWIASSLTAIVFFIPESCGHGPKLCAVVAPTHQTAGTVLIVVTISLPLSTLVEVALVAAVLPAPAVHPQVGDLFNVKEEFSPRYSIAFRGFRVLQECQIG